jgi:hypothetical protein
MTGLLKVATHPTDLAQFCLVTRRGLEHGYIVDRVHYGREERGTLGQRFKDGLDCAARTRVSARPRSR